VGRVSTELGFDNVLGAKSAIIKRAIGMCCRFQKLVNSPHASGWFSTLEWTAPSSPLPRANDLRTMCCKRARSLNSQSGRNPRDENPFAFQIDPSKNIVGG